ncbi:MAG TPA: hypothetical protein VIF39_03860 [Hyphomicrobium sp.]|jgi:hypothetical protein
MKNVSRYRAMGSLHRQCAVLNPQQSWKHLGEAERWEHLAEAEISDYFRQCNVTGPDDAGKSGAADPRLTAGPRPRAA